VIIITLKNVGDIRKRKTIKTPPLPYTLTLCNFLREFPNRFFVEINLLRFFPIEVGQQGENVSDE